MQTSLFIIPYRNIQPVNPFLLRGQSTQFPIAHYRLPLTLLQITGDSYSYTLHFLYKIHSHIFIDMPLMPSCPPSSRYHAVHVHSSCYGSCLSLPLDSVRLLVFGLAFGVDYFSCGNRVYLEPFYWLPEIVVSHVRHPHFI